MFKTLGGPVVIGELIAVRQDEQLILHSRGAGETMTDAMSRAYRTIDLGWTTLDSRGRRPWFICPSCRSRVARLYSPKLACRTCSNLRYQSEHGH